MSFIASEIGKSAAEGIANVSKVEVSVKEVSAKFEVPQSRIEYPSNFEEPPKGYSIYDSADSYYDGVDPQDVADLDFNPYDVFLDESNSGSSGEFVRGGKFDNLAEMLNSDPAVQETGELWTAEDVKNIFDDYANADTSTRREIIENFTDRLNADPKLQEIGELWTAQDVKEVFFDDYNEEQAIKDLNKVFEV